MCVSEFMPNVGDVYGWDVKFDTRLEINDYDSVFDICQQQFWANGLENMLFPGLCSNIWYRIIH